MIDTCGLQAVSTAHWHSDSEPVRLNKNAWGVGSDDMLNVSSRKLPLPRAPSQVLLELAAVI